jgi:predicted aspartyl protease
MTDNPSSCILKIDKNRFRALIDTGAAVFLISKIFDSLPLRPQENRKDIPFLQAANGNSLTSIGSTEMKFRISGLHMTQKFYVTDGLNRNMILGREWMTKHKVRLYFDLGLMRINGKTYTELKEDIHISTIVRTTKKLNIKPNTVTVFKGKANNNFPIEQVNLVEVHINNTCNCLLDDPGIYIKDSVCTMNESRQIPFYRSELIKQALQDSPRSHCRTSNYNGLF